MEFLLEFMFDFNGAHMEYLSFNHSIWCKLINGHFINLKFD